MKTIYNYAFRIVCVYVLALSIFAVTSLEITSRKVDSKVVNTNGTKQLESSIIMKVLEHEEETVEAVPEENTEIEEQEETVEESVLEEPKEEVKSTYTYVQTIDTSTYQVLETVSGNLSHYGHDCYGCTLGRTASGYDISDGRIYYTDPTFGSVRIVAAGAEFPLGTILRLTNVESNPIIAIVLDRGSAIGQGRSFTLDLLTESNAKAYELGIRNGVLIEVLRFGY